MSHPAVHEGGDIFCGFSYYNTLDVSAIFDCKFDE